MIYPLTDFRIINFLMFCRSQSPKQRVVDSKSKEVTDVRKSKILSSSSLADNKSQEVSESLSPSKSASMAKSEDPPIQSKRATRSASREPTSPVRRSTRSASKEPTSPIRRSIRSASREPTSPVRRSTRSTSKEPVSPQSLGNAMHLAYSLKCLLICGLLFSLNVADHVKGHPYVSIKKIIYSLFLRLER